MKRLTILGTLTLFLSSCMPIVTAPKVGGIVLQGNEKTPISGAKIYSRKNENAKFKLKTISDHQGFFEVPASWGVIPIPHSYYLPQRELLIEADNYKNYKKIVTEDSKKSGTRIVLNPVLENE